MCEAWMHSAADASSRSDFLSRSDAEIIYEASICPLHHSGPFQLHSLLFYRFLCPSMCSAWSSLFLDTTFHLASLVSLTESRRFSVKQNLFHMHVSVFKKTQTCAWTVDTDLMFVSQTDRLCNHVFLATWKPHSHKVSVDVSSPERPDPPTDLELTDVKKRSVQLTWIPGDDHNSPVQCTSSFWVSQKLNSVKQ